MNHCSCLSHCRAMIYVMAYNYCSYFIGQSLLLLPLSWSVALPSTTFPHTSQTRPTTTSQKGCLSPAIPLTTTSSSSSSSHCLTSIVTWITCQLHVITMLLPADTTHYTKYSYHNVRVGSFGKAITRACIYTLTGHFIRYTCVLTLIVCSFE